MSTKTPAQQEALDQARKAKRTREEKPALVVEQPKPEPTYQETLQSILNEFKLTGFLPNVSWKRTAITVFVATALTYGVGSLIGHIASYAIAGIVTFGGSMALGWLIWALSILLVVYAGLKINQHVGNYILSGQIDKDIVKLKNKFSGVFKREEKLIVATA